MFNQKKIAIMGTGNIAKIMARTIKRMKNVKCYAVASRDMDRAQAFAKEFGVKRAYGSYEEMMTDNRIDLVYIATPHSEHYANMKLCIENGFRYCVRRHLQRMPNRQRRYSSLQKRSMFL